MTGFSAGTIDSFKALLSNYVSHVTHSPWRMRRNFSHKCFIRAGICLNDPLNGMGIIVAPDTDPALLTNTLVNTIIIQAVYFSPWW